jgi:hypothetical protein
VGIFAGSVIGCVALFLLVWYWHRFGRAVGLVRNREKDEDDDPDMILWPDTTVTTKFQRSLLDEDDGEKKVFCMPLSDLVA